MSARKFICTFLATHGERMIFAFEINQSQLLNTMERTAMLTLYVAWLE
jgi:hypothetical protein